MASEIKVDSIVNSSGDEDSGFDLSTNDVVKTKTANSERMRIDSNGHVLVGKTTTAVNTQGIQLGSNGRFFATSDGAETGVFNRKTSNGTIIDLRKDNTTMGSIGTGSSRICIGNGDTFLTVAEDLDALYPASSSETTPRDNAVDLGTSGTRFNNLYLSGGVFVGGTGPGNKLDDYEEGAHNPTSGSGVSMSASVGSYSKVGNICVLYFRVVFGSESSSSNAYISLPFTSKSESINAHFASGVPFYTTYSASQIRYGVLQNTSQLYFYDGQTGQISFSDLSTRQVNGSIVYLTA